MLSEFKAFLLKQNVVALAIAVVVGTALNKLITSVVEGLIMPFVGALSPANAWEKATLDIGPVKLGVGMLAAALLNFLIVAFVAWRMAKFFIKDKEPENLTTKCTFCLMDVDKKARRCPHCTSELVPT